jgi:hypothetical protein
LICIVLYRQPEFSGRCIFICWIHGPGTVSINTAGTQLSGQIERRVRECRKEDKVVRTISEILAVRTPTENGAVAMIGDGQEREG